MKRAERTAAAACVLIGIVRPLRVRALLCLALGMAAPAISGLAGETNMMSEHAPATLATTMRTGPPVRLWLGPEELCFEDSGRMP